MHERRTAHLCHLDNKSANEPDSAAWRSQAPRGLATADSLCAGPVTPAQSSSRRRWPPDKRRSAKAPPSELQNDLPPVAREPRRSDSRSNVLRTQGYDCWVVPQRGFELELDRSQRFPSLRNPPPVERPVQSLSPRPRINPAERTRSETFPTCDERYPPGLQLDARRNLIRPGELALHSQSRRAAGAKYQATRCSQSLPPYTEARRDAQSCLLLVRCRQRTPCSRRGGFCDIPPIRRPEPARRPSPWLDSPVRRAMGTDQGGRLPRELAREKARQVARRSEQHSRSVAASDLCSLPAGSPGWMWIRHAGTTRH